MLDIKLILSQNVTKLLDTRRDISRLDLSKQMGVADGTLGRIKYGTGNPNAETIEQIAYFFRFEPWQLLVKGFDPKKPPLLLVDAKAPTRVHKGLGSPESKSSASEDELLNLFRQLDEPERTYLLQHAQQYAERVDQNKSSEKNTGTGKQK